MAESMSDNGVRKHKATFKFVNYQQPGDAKDTKIRTQVRSHVSRWQHQRSRDRYHSSSAKKAQAISGTATSPCEDSTGPEYEAGLTQLMMISDKSAMIRSSKDLADSGSSVSAHECMFRSIPWREFTKMPVVPRNHTLSRRQDYTLTCARTNLHTTQSELSSERAKGFASRRLSQTAHNPLERSIACGTSAFGIFMLDDPSSIIAESLNTFGLDALGVVVRIVSFSDKGVAC